MYKKKKFSIFNYGKHKVGNEYKRDIRGKPFIVNREYSLEEKIDYYSKRIGNMSLTENQRNHAKMKVNILTTGVGRIYTIADKELGNPNYDNNKPRRVVATAINHKTGNVLINGLYTTPSYYNKLKINCYDADGRIPMLDYESYLNVQAKKKLDNTFFNIKDLSETTSTVDPKQLVDILDYVYPKVHKQNVEKHNKYLKRQLFKDK